uniref:LON peptidase N-terminal domain and RING finger protein 1 n=1 Tax=Talaromyces marneffei PM1 TaxID=1077442 RepID=A0A093V6E3_TALMA
MSMIPYNERDLYTYQSSNNIDEADESTGSSETQENTPSTIDDNTLSSSVRKDDLSFLSSAVEETRGNFVFAGEDFGVFEKVANDFEDGKQQWSGTDVCMQWKMTMHATGVADEAETESDDVTTHPKEEGRLPYDAGDVVYEDTAVINNEKEELLNDDTSNKIDEVIYEQLRTGIRDELDCRVCYGLIVDPCISPCGHSFCYECANRIRDTSNLCPLCRKKMDLSFREGPNPAHGVLRCLLDAFFPDEIKSRKEAIEEDGTCDDDELPLFVCTLAFPSTSTHLHIFEPRYRLMIRRALDSGNSKFGMVTHNFYHDLATEGHPDRSPEPFMQYGTAVRIEWRDFLPDGRIMLTAVGMHKFKILRYGVLDGYYRAHTERVDDISLAEEETLEARELAAANQNNQPANGSPLNALSTQQLMQICMDFLEKQRMNSAPAVRERINRVFGQPPTDPAIFPYWFANVLPIPDEEAYKIIPLTSVRERLKVAATWPDNHHWSNSTPFDVAGDESNEACIALEKARAVARRRRGMLR